MELNEIRVKKQQFIDGLVGLIDTFQDVTGVRIVTINAITLPEASDKGGRKLGIDVILERI
jgi:hypothetical protein